MLTLHRCRAVDWAADWAVDWVELPSARTTAAGSWLRGAYQAQDVREEGGATEHHVPHGESQGAELGHVLPQEGPERRAGDRTQGDEHSDNAVKGTWACAQQGPGSRGALVLVQKESRVAEGEAHLEERPQHGVA